MTKKKSQRAIGGNLIFSGDDEPSSVESIIMEAQAALAKLQTRMNVTLTSAGRAWHHVCKKVADNWHALSINCAVIVTALMPTVMAALGASPVAALAVSGVSATLALSALAWDVHHRPDVVNPSGP